MSKPILLDRTEPDVLAVVSAAFVAEGFDKAEADVLAEVVTKALKADSIKFQRSGRAHPSYQMGSGGAV